MHLYLIRHAEAVSIEVNGCSRDEDRPLTPTGQQQCRRLLAGLKQVGVQLTVLYTSPLVRARQTAEGLASQWGENGPLVRECEALAPGGKKRKVLTALRESGSEPVGLVGHNPDMSELVGWFMGDKNVGLELAKAAIACLEFDGRPTKGGGTLIWLVTPSWLPQVE